MKLHNDTYTIITGGAGFIGSCLLRELNNRSISKIIVVDSLESGEKWKNIAGKHFSDFIQKEHLFSWLKGRASEINAFFHLGACSSTTELNADFLLENNYRYSRMLVEYALQHTIPILVASSAATYGDGSLGFSDEHALLENLQPLNMYGYSKHLIDLWLHRENVLDQVLSIKYFNIFGPNEWHKGRMASRIMGMVDQAQNQNTIELFASSHPDYANGEQKRDFMYVKDAVCCSIDLLEKSYRGVYNVGSGVASSWNELASAVFYALNLPVHISYLPMPADLHGKYQYYTKAKVEKLMTALGPQPCKYDLNRAVADYINNHILTQKRW